MDIHVIEADFENAEHCEALVYLIDSYARGPGGQSAPITPEATELMIPGLRRHPAKLVLLAMADGSYAGTAVCYWLFSTFTGKPFLNIHDLTVAPEYRNRGIGTRLLTEAEQHARETGCSRLALEVRTTNTAAQRLYERLGFGPSSDADLYLAKPLT